METEHLPAALADFSGYAAADELYDGPFCILSLVDSRHQRRLLFEVLEQAPTSADIERFLRRFQQALAERGLVLHGITTDGSQLYPGPLRAVFGAVRHQVCEFHVLADVNQAILHAVAQVRKRLRQQKVQLPRGRPTRAEHRAAAQHNRRLQQRIGGLFEHRYLFVQRLLTAAQRKLLRRISRGLPELRTLRAIAEEVYRLFDRRCKTATALEKLRRLRERVRQFRAVGKTLQTLFTPHLEKALTCLDDRLLPATSNAVERGNRRYRKMQQSVYRVRTRRAIVGRLALDLLREQQASERSQTLSTLHRARAG